MTQFFRALLDVTVLVFPIASMLGIGLSYTFRQIVQPLRDPGLVIGALVANFVLVPLLAVGLARFLNLEPSIGAGLILIATAAGAPFLIKLVEAANADTKLSATLLVLLMPISVAYMTFVVPLLVADATVSPMAIAVPLVLTLLVPLLVGFVVDSIRPNLAARVRPFAFKTGSYALLLLLISTVVLNAPRFRELLGTGAITAAFVITIGAFAAGYLLSGSGFDRRTVMGLGTGQRNIGAALVVASVDFGDPRTLVMVVLVSVVAMLVLFPIAWTLRRGAPRDLPAEARESQGRRRRESPLGADGGVISHRFHRGSSDAQQESRP